MFDKFKQVMEMRKQAEKIKKELDATNVEVDEVRGIKLVISGSQRFHYLEIDSDLMKPENKKHLESHLLQAMNTAVRKSQEVGAKKMKEMTGLNLPGM